MVLSTEETRKERKKEEEGEEEEEEEEEEEGEGEDEEQEREREEAEPRVSSRSGMPSSAPSSYRHLYSLYQPICNSIVFFFFLAGVWRASRHGASDE